MARAVIIGAGMGGLAPALRLAWHGFQVIVAESSLARAGVASYCKKLASASIPVPLSW